MSFLKKQFVDVIQWAEPSAHEGGILAYRYPMQDQEIQSGAQLTVRDSQLALFVNEGQVADLFGPGRHTLTTQTLPVLTNLRHWDKAFASPFKSDVYFFSTREQLDRKWGTSQPITVRDRELGALRIRAHGAYSFRIADAKAFHQKISGTREVYTVGELEGQLRSIIATSIASRLGAAETAFLDLAADQARLSQALKESLEGAFRDYGLALATFRVESLSLPEEVQAYLDKGTSARVVGDLAKYAQFQAADAIGAAARQDGGLAGAGVGLGAGAAIGQAMGQALGGLGQGAAGGGTDAVAMINKLHELFKAGVLSQAEFEAKKAELLKKI